MTEMLYKAQAPAAAAVARLAVYEVHTGDVDRLVDYYEHSLNLVLVERSGDAAYLTTGTDHHCVVIRHGDADGRARVGFEIAGTLDDTAQRLEAAGVSFERRTDPEPGVVADIVIREQDTDTPLTLAEPQPAHGAPSVISGRPSKLGHVASYVPDLAASQRFYLEVLGFRWSDMMGDFFTFLRCNADHHAINLMRSTIKHGLFHVAFEMRDISHLKDALDHLAAREIRLQWGPGRHGAGHNIFTYHHDPDGNLIELFTEIDVIYDEKTGQFLPRPWHETWPQMPKFWTPDVGAANKWGPIDPESMAH